MTLQSFDILTKEHGQPVNKLTDALEMLFKAIGIGTSQIQIAEAATNVLKIFGVLRVNAAVGDDDVIIKSQYASGINSLQGQVDTINAHLAVIDSSLGASAALVPIIDKICSELPLEYIVAASEGQTLFDAPNMTWTNDNTCHDILVFVNGRKMRQAASGGDFHKQSNVRLIFEVGLKANATVNIKQNIPWSVVVSFLNYTTAITGYIVPTYALYNQSTNQLAAFKNGYYLANTANPALGDPVDRYTESNRYAITLEEATLATAFFVVWNRSFTPTARQVINGLTGLNIVVPTYTMGNKTLMVYRDGLLLNAAALGANIMQYSEDDTTHIALLEASLAATLWIFEVLPSAPTWRQDQSNVAGVTLTFGTAYVMGNKKLFLYKNGKLMMNTSDTDLGTSNDRYVEATVNTVTLETASVLTDVWSAIYF